MNKRGISNVVAVVLIILLTILIITITWISIMSTIKKSSDLKTTEILINTADGYTAYNPATKIACVQIERIAQSEKIIKIQIIFSINGNSKEFFIPIEESDDSIPELNNKKTYCFNLSEYGKPELVKVSPVYAANKLGSPDEAIMPSREVTKDFEFKIMNTELTEEEPLEPLDLTALYVDNQLSSNCLSNNYNITSRTCDANEQGANAYKTIQSASSVSNPGDNINIRQGDYNEHILVQKGGTENNYISYHPYKNEQVIIYPGILLTNWITTPEGFYNLTLETIPQYPNNVLLIKKDSFPISKMSTYENLSNPSVAAGYLTQQEVLSEDAFYYNTNTNTITLRLVSGNPEDIYFVDASFKGFNIVAPYIEIKGLTIKYAIEGVKAQYIGNSHGNNIRIINNTITNCGHGILATEDNYLIEGNTITYIGSPFWSNGNSPFGHNHLDHAMYLSGSNGIVRNNFMDKCYYYCMHPYHSGDGTKPQNMQIYNNYIGNGLALSGTNNTIYNNIIEGTNYIYANSGNKFLNNLFFNGTFEIPGTSGQGNQIIFKNNIILRGVQLIDGYCITIYPPTNISSYIMDNNLYYNCNWFQADWIIHQVFYGFNNYKNFMTNLNLELNSIFANPQLDSNLIPQPESPAINSGQCLEEVSFDYNRNPRPSSGCDIGPFEQ